ncbi:MAG: GNAT family N-acetyltransferase, partial [Clostridia bacterium]|nr:GNAT family N-acetyltransferase [Clostridia bacterium]
AVDEENGKTIGCATLCYMEFMPTFSHPTGKRSHLMNVYTVPVYRGQGIARCMVEMLMEEALRKGVTEISLDATAVGRPLYRKLGFRDSEECMVLVLD